MKKYILIMLLVSCKSVVVEKQPSTEFSESIKELEQEKFTLESEFQAFKLTLAEYKKSEMYNNPKSEDEKAFAGLIEAADLLEEKDVKKFIEEKRFSLAENRIENELDSISSKVDEMIKPKQEDERTNLQKGTAIFSIVLGSMGVLGAITSAGITRNWGLLANIPACAYPLIVGAFIIKDKKRDEYKVAMQQSIIGIGAGLVGLASTMTLIAGIFTLNEFSRLKRIDGYKNISLRRGGLSLLGISILGVGVTVGMSIWTARLGDQKAKAKITELSNLSLTENRVERMKETTQKMARAFFAFKSFELL